MRLFLGPMICFLIGVLCGPILLASSIDLTDWLELHDGTGTAARLEIESVKALQIYDSLQVAETNPQDAPEVFQKSVAGMTCLRTRGLFTIVKCNLKIDARLGIPQTVPDFQVPANEQLNLSFQGPVATQVYNYLQVTPKPVDDEGSWQKIAPGILCQNRPANCTLDISTLKGVLR